MYRLETNLLALQSVVRKPDSHKGSHGSVAVVGGNEGMLGAALLCGRSALAAGTGKVWLNALDQRLAVDTTAPELMIRTANSDLSAAQALAVGPGLGQDRAAYAILGHTLNLPDLPAVFDADALNLLALDEGYRQQIITRAKMPILTPHPLEAARLLACDARNIQANRIESARRLALRYNSIILLKGKDTVIYHPNDDYVVNQTGGAELGVAGQGDVLTGVIAALLAQGIGAFDAATLGAHIHGMAGDLYTQKACGYIGLTASATVVLISEVLNKLVYEINTFSELPI